MRALGAPRAHALHARAPSRSIALPPSSRPDPGPCLPAEPRTTLAHSPEPSKPPLAPYSAAVRAPLAARRRRQRALPWTAPPKPPARASCPLEQLELILEPVGTRSSPPRRPAATERRSPAFLSTAAAGPTSNAYIRGPQARSSPQATSGHPRSTPLSQQSAISNRLPQLRPVRPPPPSGAIHRNQPLPRASNTTIRFPSTSRSRPSS